MKRLSLGFALLCSATAVAAQTLQAQPQWQHIDGMHQALGRDEALGDFDADGTPEIAILGEIATSDYKGANIGVAGHDAIDGWRWKDMLHLSGDFVAPLLTLQHPEGDQILLLRESFGGQPNVLLRYGGTPLRQLGALPLPDATWLLAAGDVDGNGDIEVIVGNASAESVSIVARDVESGVVRWTQTGYPTGFYGMHVELAQLDADPALEVIVSGSPGLVFDGALGLVEWSHAGGFSSFVRAGNFDLDAATELVSVAATGPDATVFDTAPYTPAGTVGPACCPLGISALAVGDVDADGIDEWVVLSNGLHVVEPLTGASTTIVLPNVSKRSVRVANFDADPAPEIMINGYQGAYPRLRVIDADGAFDTVFDSWSEHAPGYAMVIGDLEGNGGEQIAYLGMNGHGGGVAGDDTVMLRIRDAATGALLRAAPVPEFLGAGPPLEMMIATAQLDDDPALELAIAPLFGNGSRLVVLDSVDFSRMYTLEYSDMSLGARALEFADIDVDGDTELVVLGVDLRVQVYDGATGVPAWATGDIEFHDGGEMVVRNVDSDPALEVLVHNGRDVIAWDGATQQLAWMIQGATTGSRFVVFDRGGECRIGLYDPWRYLEHACGAGPVLRDIAPEASAARLVPVLLDDEGLLAASGGHLVRFDTATGAVSALSDGLGVNFGLVADSIRVPAPGRIFAGNDGVIRRLQLVEMMIFTDGFE